MIGPPPAVYSSILATMPREPPARLLRHGQKFFRWPVTSPREQRAHLFGRRKGGRCDDRPAASVRRFLQRSPEHVPKRKTQAI